MSKLFINKKVWNEFTDHQMKLYQNRVFKYYRENGFPYFPTDRTWRWKEYEKTRKYDFKKCIDKKNKLIKQTMHGLALCWSYHPYHYKIQCNNMMTVMEAFNDDEIFKKVIAKRTKMGDNMSDNGIRKMLKIFTGVQCVSNFRPTAAAAIYSMFCGKGDLVYDMSFGFGGRCLGAHLAGVNYYGVDPSINAFYGVDEMIGNFDEEGITAEIVMRGSEERSYLEANSVKLCFTSPPYFNCEKYSDDETQSYKKYKTKDEWMNGFLHDTLIECKRVVKSDGHIVLNIQNVKTYPDLVADTKKLCKKIGLKLVDEWGLQLSSLAGGGHKSEPLLIFKEK